MSDTSNISDLGLLPTAFLLGVIGNLDPHFEQQNRNYLLELAQKNPRVFGIICEADALRSHIAQGIKLI